VIREYVGKGPLAELVAQTDALQRRRLEEEANTWRAECQHLEDLDRSVEELDEVARVLTRAALLTAGFRQHNRGEWRKRRG